MSATSSLSEILQNALDSRDNLIEVVDGLLRVCAENDMHLRMLADSGLFRSTNRGRAEHAFKNPLTKSRFRAVLARIALLCNEATPGSASPYGGMGTVPISPDRLESVYVSFANTPDEPGISIPDGIASNHAGYDDSIRHIHHTQLGWEPPISGLRPTSADP